MNTRTTYLASKPHYEILDGLRGVAAVMVIIFHLFEAHAGGSHLTQIINHGYLAVDFFFMLILILMSGLFTPIHSMPEWAQWITRINPLRYFVEVMRTIYLRGGGFAELFPQLGALLVFALVFNLWAVKSYKKSS